MCKRIVAINSSEGWTCIMLLCNHKKGGYVPKFLAGDLFDTPSFGDFHYQEDYQGHYEERYQSYEKVSVTENLF